MPFIYLFYMDLRTNSVRFPTVIGFYNRDGVCSLDTRNESHIQLRDTKDGVLLCWSSCCYELNICEGG
jgi:hypothetical protein